MKAHTHTETIDILNDLIETCRDGAHGFRTAADDAKDPVLQRHFRDFAQQRDTFVEELQQCVRTCGGDIEKSGSAAGALHRGWIDLKAALSTNEPHAVLAECERGEDHAVDQYRDALEKLEDPLARDLVSRQFATIVSTHDLVRDLRDSPTYRKR